MTVTSGADGNYTNSTGGISSAEGGGGAPAAAALTVAAPPSITEAFSAGAIGQGAVTSLTFTIANPNSRVTLTGVGFSDSLPSALPVAAPKALSSNCGGMASAPAGGSSVSLSWGQLGPGATCTVSLHVLGATTAQFTSTSSAVSSAEGGDGNASQASLTVIGPPRVTVTSPTPGASYRFGQKVRASYSCADDLNGPGISSCTADVPNGGVINTSKPGLHIFTVTAVSADGGNSSDLVFYTVGPDSRFKVLDVRAHPDGSLDFRVKVPGAGLLTVIEKVGSRPASAFARGQRRAKGAATLHLVVRPNARGRQTLKRQAKLRLSVAVSYTPKGGTKRTIRFNVTLRR